MKKNIKVLVDGVGGDVGQGIVKSLLDSNLTLEIFVADNKDSASWLYKIDKSYIFPNAEEDYFIEFLINFLINNKIDIYFPSIDSSIMKLSKNKELIESSTNTKIFIDNYEKIKICNDKYLTQKFLINHSFDSPETCQLINKEEVESFFRDNKPPFILKPKIGNGSNDIHRIFSYHDLDSYLFNPDYILQELLDVSFEITSGIYFGDDAEVKGIYVLSRELRNGSTYSANRVINECLNTKLIEIAKSMNMKYINIQAVYKNNVLIPFEFNGRLSGTTGAMRSVFNAPEFFIREKILAEKIQPSTNFQDISFSRYYEEVYYAPKDKINLIERSKYGK
jgi:carbamoyl-phosphate synthase large subunit